MSEQKATVTIAARVEPSVAAKLDTLAIFSGSRTNAIIDAIECCHAKIDTAALGAAARLRVQQDELRQSVYSDED